MFFFWQAFGRDAFYSLKCLESVPFPLQPVSFHCSAVSVFAWKPEGKGQLLWPCESRSEAWGKGGDSCGPLGHKQWHVYLQTLKDRHVCWRPFIASRKAERGFHGGGRAIDYWRMTQCVFPGLKGSQFLGFLVFFQETKTNEQGFACISATWRQILHLNVQPWHCWQSPVVRVGPIVLHQLGRDVKQILRKVCLNTTEILLC